MRFWTLETYLSVVCASLSQVETVGDKYMAVSGLPELCESHAKCMARLALDMIIMAQHVKMGNEPVVSMTIVCNVEFEK